LPKGETDVTLEQALALLAAKSGKGGKGGKTATAGKKPAKATAAKPTTRKKA